MGVTIHYECRTKNRKSVMKSIAFVKEMAKGEKILTIDEVDHPKLGLGIYINNEGETFSWVWNEYHEWRPEWNPKPGEYVISNFTKTQAFRSEVLLPAVSYHIWIAEVLDTIKRCWLPELEISDEGDYLLKRPTEKAISYWKELQTKYGVKEDYFRRYMLMKPKDPANIIQAYGENLAVMDIVMGQLSKVGWQAEAVERVEHPLAERTIGQILDSWKKDIQAKVKRNLAKVDAGVTCAPVESWPPMDLAKRAGVSIHHINPGNICPPGQEETDGFCAQRLEDPAHFDKRSFRTTCPKCPSGECDRCEELGIELDDTAHLVIGCSKGEYDPKTDVCKTSTRGQTILRPK